MPIEFTELMVKCLLIIVILTVFNQSVILAILCKVVFDKKKTNMTHAHSPIVKNEHVTPQYQNNIEFTALKLREHGVLAQKHVPLPDPAMLLKNVPVASGFGSKATTGDKPDK